MTALKSEAIRLVEQMSEEQMPYVIQYIKNLKAGHYQNKEIFNDDAAATPKMKAFLELEEMLVPVSPELDYDKELAQARDEKYGYFG